MGADIIQTQYDQLEEIARRFGQQAEAQATLRKHVQTGVERLRNTGWIGRGSDAFYAEMDGKVFPATQRLITALQEAKKVTLQISQVLQHAEADAAAPFRSQDSAKSIATTSSSADEPPPPTAEEIARQFEDFKNNRPPRSPVTTFPTGLAGDIARWLGITPQQVTEHEANLLGKLWPWQLKSFSDIHDRAFDYESAYFGADSNNDGPADAFRHATWSALLTREFGTDWALEYTGAHEELPGNQAAREYMDRYNNALGVRIASENPDLSGDALVAKIAEAIRNGEGVYIPGANEYPLGDPLGDLQRDRLAETGPLTPTDEQLSPNDLLPVDPPTEPGSESTR